jgi:tRNA(fMet)-specific endonuclease VapC
VSLRYLLDTNAISEPIRPRPNAEFIERLRGAEGSIAIAAITWHELLFGLRRLPDSARKSALERYLFDVVGPSVVILNYDRDAATWHAAERARLSLLGQTPSFADGQIAAIAAVHDLTLVTANTADFISFSGLDVVDWRESDSCGCTGIR